MNKIFFGALFFLVSCGPAQTATAVPPTEILNQFPTPLPSPTLAVLTKPIEDEEEAFNFFYEQKIHVALGEYEHFAEEIRYPITVKVDGQLKTFIYAAEFEANFEKIFSEVVIQEFISIDESALTFLPNGVKVADGIIWFDLICMDPACDEAEYLITEINN
jgi:hypothetical protein